ncbi:MAG: hypothetical protein QM705_02650 [Ancrocorticia sp.]
MEQRPSSPDSGPPGSAGDVVGAVKEVVTGIVDRLVEAHEDARGGDGGTGDPLRDEHLENVLWIRFPQAPSGGGAPIVVDPASLIIISDVQRLVTDAGQVVINPSRTWLYVNKPVFFATDAVAHDRQLTILGLPVTVHLTPVGYMWDPGDGSAVFTSSSPGGVWPDGDVKHSYRKANAGVSVGLTVEWSATFTVQGTTYPVAGTTTATTASPVFEIREAEAVLTR